jgi:hypothetical protein
MKILSLKQFVAQAEDQEDPPDPEVYAMTVQDFLNEIRAQWGNEYTAIVTVNPQEPNTLSVKFVVFDDDDQIVMP